MIQKAEVDTAIEAAAKFLEHDAAWVKKSAMLEQAYRIGVYAGLQGIAQEEHLNRLLLDAIIETRQMRRADDTFNSTKIGRTFETLKSQLLKDNPSLPAAKETLNELINDVQQRAELWESLLRQSTLLLADLQKFIAEHPAVSSTASSVTLEKSFGERAKLLEHLEHCLRQISLQEADHRIWNKILE